MDVFGIRRQARACRRQSTAPQFNGLGDKVLSVSGVWPFGGVVMAKRVPERLRPGVKEKKPPGLNPLRLLADRTMARGRDAITRLQKPSTISAFDPGSDQPRMPVEGKPCPCLKLPSDRIQSGLCPQKIVLDRLFEINKSVLDRAIGNGDLGFEPSGVASKHSNSALKPLHALR